MEIPVITLLASTILNGLVAGLLYAFVCSVNPGLAALGDREYLTAMQSINQSIQNPLFFLSFMGTLILLPLCCFVMFRQTGLSLPFGLLLSATLIYVFAVFGITMFGNVPLNDYLAKIDLAALSPEALASARNHFEKPWNGLHQLRTIASVISFGLLALGCYFKGL